MFIIGLTGGIASGKSTVTDILRELGLPVIDADQVAREIVEPGQRAYNEIVREFGPTVVGSDGHLNRKVLGDLVFANPDLRQKLNRITHPRLWEVFDYRMQQLPPDTDIVVWDVPLLLETGMDDKVDEVWLVWVDELMQIERLMKRDNLTEEEARKRLNAQMSVKEKMKRAHRLIDNRGTVEETRELVTSFYNEVKSMINDSRKYMN
ncbi:MAG: dephospho-CoA kinase [Syntrophomonadaceae bacterium]|nr:dephospho-CoA kinase [Syntrophomonadaceae bacterium]